MKKIIPIALVCITIAGMSACKHKQAPMELKTTTDTISWVMGESLARSIQNINIGADPDIIRKAFLCTMDSCEQPIDEETYKMVYDYINMAIAQQQMQRKNQMQQAGKDAEAKYFAELEKKPNIKKSDKGFYYEVLTKGHGPKAQFAQRVKFDYKSYFMLSGETFDQTYGVREPVLTTIGNQIIPGLREGMQLMQAGSKFRFYLPSEMAYGSNGKEGVAPYTPMIYDIELYEIYND